jgi:hypothetical protein
MTRKLISLAGVLVAVVGFTVGSTDAEARHCRHRSRCCCQRAFIQQPCHSGCQQFAGNGCQPMDNYAPGQAPNGTPGPATDAAPPPVEGAAPVPNN